MNDDLGNYDNALDKLVTFSPAMIDWSNRMRRQARAALLAKKTQNNFTSPDDALHAGKPCAEGPSEVGLARAQAFDVCLGKALRAVVGAASGPFDHLQPADLPLFRRDCFQDTIERYLDVYLKRLGLMKRYRPLIHVNETLPLETPASISLPFITDRDGVNPFTLEFSSVFFLNYGDVFDLILAVAHEMAHLFLHDLTVAFDLGLLSTLPSETKEVLTDMVSVLLGLGGVNAIRIYRERIMRFPAAEDAPERIVAQHGRAGYASATAIGYALGMRECLGMDNELPENVLKLYGARAPEFSLFKAGVDRARQEQHVYSPQNEVAKVHISVCEGQ